MINLLAVGNRAVFSIITGLMILIGCGGALFIWGMIQYGLSKLKSKVPGMILPILHGICSVVWLIVIIFGITQSAIGLMSTGVILLVTSLVQAVLFTIIYKKTRAKMSNISELEKMVVQDLD